MRLTYITEEWRRNGGVASYAHRLVAAMTAAGAEVQVVHNDRAAASVPNVREDYVEGCTTYSQSKGHLESSARAAGEAVRGFAPDFVHVQGCNNFVLEALLRSRYRATKTLHVYDFCPSNTKFHHALDRECSHPTSILCLPRLGYKRCTTSRRPWVWAQMQRRATDANRNNASYRKLVVASNHVRMQALATGYAPDRLDVIPYFVDDVETGTAEERTILAPGRLTREKGFDLLIEALTRVPRPWRAIIAGDGMERDALRRQAETAGLADAIEFAGWQDEASMARLYGRASVVALPSRWPEPSGIVGLEAMAHRRPVAAFAVGGIPEWLQHGVTGILAPPGDAAALGSAITSLLGDPPAASRMGQAGRARMEAEFSAAQHIPRLTALYASLPRPI